MKTPETKVYVTVIRKPTVETLRNIAHDLKLKNAALKRTLERQASKAMDATAKFNRIRGLEALATVKVSGDIVPRRVR